MSELVAYFSRAGQNYGHGGVVSLPKGNTEVLAEAIAADLGCPLFKIEPAQAYPEDYYACTDQAKQELRDDARPAIVEPLPSLEGVTTLYLGYPNWWGTVPMCVKTFLDACELAGVTIAPFCTNEGSGLGSSVRDLARAYPVARVAEGFQCAGTSAASQTGRAAAWARKARA